MFHDAETAGRGSFGHIFPVRLKKAGEEGGDTEKWQRAGLLLGGKREKAALGGETKLRAGGGERGGPTNTGEKGKETGGGGILRNTEKGQALNFGAVRPDLPERGS